jgi:hypothetical protein
MEQARLPSLPNYVSHESATEADQEEDAGCHGNQVNGPWLVASTHKVEVPRAAFVSI